MLLCLMASLITITVTTVTFLLLYGYAMLCYATMYAVVEGRVGSVWWVSNGGWGKIIRHTQREVTYDIQGVCEIWT